jgi:YbgC/YbaW family acyl-CoA thioester hydrolase
VSAGAASEADAPVPADDARNGPALPEHGRAKGRRREDFRRLHRLCGCAGPEVDLQGIVFNGHYLLYLDTALAEHWRAMALPYVDALRRLGGDLFVRHRRSTTAPPARFDDLLEVGIRCERIGTSSITFGGALYRHERALVEGELVYVFADPRDAGAAAGADAAARTAAGLRGRRADVRGSHRRLGRAGRGARALRTEVFAQEQGIPSDDDVRRGRPPARCTRWPTTGSACRSPPGGWSSAAVGWPRSAAWRCVSRMRGGGVGRALLSALQAPRLRAAAAS